MRIRFLVTCVLMSGALALGTAPGIAEQHGKDQLNRGGYNSAPPRGGNTNRNTNRNVHVHHGYHHGGYHRWAHEDYYGAVIAGVTLGAIIVAASAPVSPEPGLCWLWADEAQTQGYWDYC